MSRAVMQQALAYIEEVDYGPYDKWPVIIALKQALAEPEQKRDPVVRNGWVVREVLFDNGEPLSHREPEQKPVAWAEEIIDDLHALYDTEMIRENDSGDALIRLDDAIACVEDAKQHHTAPTPRKPLTDEEIQSIWAKTFEMGSSANTFARAIEHAHGIGEQP